MNMDTACGTAPLGRQHEVHHTAGSAYVDTDEERRAANTSDKKISVEQSQGTPEAASHAITIMVNYIGVTDIESRGGRAIIFSRGTGEDFRKIKC